ncbi:ribonuclease R [Candidatus Kaiserbacteria bacterium]|nr:ribonuclease R [Candidatus Kaiserbacteria bacterium]
MQEKELEGVIAIRGKGFGFVNIPDQEDDIYIPVEETGTALDTDVVRISVSPAKDGKRAEGRVLEIISRGHEELIGVVEKDGENYILNPDNRRIHIKPILPSATQTDEGMKVAATLDAWTDREKTPTAQIVDTLGVAGQHETEMQAIIRSGGFSEDFPREVQDAAQELHKNQAQIFADAEKDPKRRDMRGTTTMTIDPADAKDFDDALSFEMLPNGNREIGIHIADVSHYVTEGDPLDVEAAERGTSIYLVDRVIPMLPEILSNDLCSLRPDEDRLAFSAVFEINEHGKVVDEWYGQTLIHSDKRFSYEDAQKVLDDDEGEYHEELSEMMRLARIIRKARYAAGAIAFEQPEVRFELDDAGKPVRVYTKERTETMLMIEDYMLLANQSVSTFINELSKKNGKDAAFIYRIHDMPDAERIEELAIFLKALGYELKTHKGVVEAKDINKLMKEVEGTPEEALIKTATIRSMAKAIYSTKNIGHFGLAFKYYSHFTSPIRRYPDLMAHRLLRKHLDNSPISGREKTRYEKLSVQSSERELNAVRAERDSIKYKQVEYMLDKVGQEFDGTVTGVSDWGIYVQDNESRAEGMVRLSEIKGDYFEHEASKYRIKGQKTGKSYQLGDEVRIKLVKADMEEKNLDFVLV